MTTSDASLPAPGWYPDGRGAERWWSGRDWTEHTRPLASIPVPQPQPQPSLKTHEIAPHSQETPTSALIAETARESSPRKVSFFGAKKTAENALARNEELEATIERYGLTALSDREGQLRSLDDEIRERRTVLTALQHDLEVAHHEVDAERAALIDVRHALAVQELGIYDYEHPAESSASLATRLGALRSRIKDAVRLGHAVSATHSFTFNNSAAQGRKFVSDMTKILLRAYNAEAENAVKSVRAGSLTTAQARLSKAAEMIARQGQMIDLAITPSYHRLRLEEIEIAASHLQAIQREKELERARREELREQRKAEQELRAERERLEKERQHYLSTMQKLAAQGDAEGAARMQERLDSVEKAIAGVDYRQANVRAGYVYVISNVGAFGPDVVKIGMTRRLEPMERIDELGDASVPFRFDVHALFFADDAVAIETMLHQTFAIERMNRVNLRREFFYTTPERVLDVLKAHQVEVVEWRMEAAATEYHESTRLAAARP